MSALRALSATTIAQVLLARQMEQSAKDFAAWRKNREREVQQLRRAGRKQAAHVQKLEALQAKQSAVLRRKTEEAEAARRRLKVCALPMFFSSCHNTCRASNCFEGHGQEVNSHVCQGLCTALLVDIPLTPA